MAKLKDLIDFENFFSEEFFKDILKHPQKLIFGVDPLGVEIGNLILGRDDKSLINQLGSPSSDIQRQAREKGIDTGLANTLHDTGDVVAGLIGAQGAAGGIESAIGSIGSGSSGAAGGGGIIPSGGGSGGGGISTATGGGGGGSSGSAAGGGFDFMSLIQQFGGGGGQQQEQGKDPLEEAIELTKQLMEAEQKRQAELRAQDDAKKQLTALLGGL
jgi:hypothetical protein